MMTDTLRRCPSCVAEYAGDRCACSPAPPTVVSESSVMSVRGAATVYLARAEWKIIYAALVELRVMVGQNPIASDRVGVDIESIDRLVLKLCLLMPLEWTAADWAALAES